MAISYSRTAHQPPLRLPTLMECCRGNWGYGRDSNKTCLNRWAYCWGIIWLWRGRYTMWQVFSIRWCVLRIQMHSFMGCSCASNGARRIDGIWCTHCTILCGILSYFIGYSGGRPFIASMESGYLLPMILVPRPMLPNRSCTSDMMVVKKWSSCLLTRELIEGLCWDRGGCTPNGSRLEDMVPQFSQISSPHRVRWALGRTEKVFEPHNRWWMCLGTVVSRQLWCMIVRARLRGAIEWISCGGGEVAFANAAYTEGSIGSSPQAAVVFDWLWVFRSRSYSVIGCSFRRTLNHEVHVGYQFVHSKMILTGFFLLGKDQVLQWNLRYREFLK